MPTDSRGSSLPARPRAVRRRGFSPAAMTVFSFVGAALIVASNSAVTPLYRLYQQSMHLTPLVITLVYAVYTFSLLAALLTVGGLSDYVGACPCAACPAGLCIGRRGGSPGCPHSFPSACWPGC